MSASTTLETRRVAWEGEARWGAYGDPQWSRVVELTFKSGGTNLCAEVRWYDHMQQESWRPAPSEVAEMAIFKKALKALSKELETANAATPSP